MGDDVRSHIINISLLRELQQAFQKDICELIDIYLHDANRKIANLYKALNEANLENFAAAARELRLRSLDIGAIQFSFRCLALEMAIQEMRLESLEPLTAMVEQQLTPVLKALALIKNKAEETNSKVLF
ncbi:MAG: hypothetical protein BGO43_01360 [Gammaproteobacteria bacterium 39-13]|nr:hypothetical protein [Gammaproteobacteria bacterium]OJV89036.1 MAG: hypothetical protein BGO43_01360 [Gammaproteobacteria bacterium 39-13]